MKSALHINHLSRLPILAAIVVLSACNSKGGSGEKKEDARSPELAQANLLTEKGYDAKQVGRNKDALDWFQQAAGKIEASVGKQSEAYASNLDDRATVYLRIGETKKAETLYAEAESILRESGEKVSRLYAGILRRIATLKALKAMGIVCREPLFPAPVKEDALSAQDGGATIPKHERLPYFPEPEDLQRAFGIFNSEMKACIDDMADSLPVWTVLSGDGRIVLASVKSEALDPEKRTCVEKELIEVSRRHPELLPRFSACFRNFTYPLAFRAKRADVPSN